jgi:O-antigen ligase
MHGSLAKSSKSTVILLSLLFCVYPFGPAFQNLGLGLFVLGALGLKYFPRMQPLSMMPRSVLWIFAGMLAYLLWCVLATFLSPSEHRSEPLAFFVGYLPLILLPWISGTLPELDSRARQKLLALASVGVLIWGLLVLSQYFFPWRWVGTSVEAARTQRAQGFYSHPMSLAYASLILWPLAIRMILKFPRRWTSWAFGIGAALLLLFSMSRVVQLLSALFTLWNIFVLLSGRQRLTACSLALLLGIVLALTENPVSVRFRHLVNPTAEELMSDYPDDRLAFWHAHLLMIEERPWTGHGVHLNLKFREPYYDRLGLSEFPKKYQAHNQYLQILAEAGIIGLFFYGSWLLAAWVAIQKYISSTFFRVTAQQTLLIFSLGCLTQNAFDDSCVRTGLVIFFCLMLTQMPGRFFGRAPEG